MSIIEYLQSALKQHLDIHLPNFIYKVGITEMKIAVQDEVDSVVHMRM